MKRDVVIVLGRTGSGKSQWSKIYTQKTVPLYVYDPLLSYPDCEVDSSGDALRGSLEYPNETDRIMIYNRELVPTMADVGYVRGGCTLLFEECSTIWAKGGRPDESVMRQIFLGRHRAVNLIFVAQRATSIPIDIRSQANRIVTFGQLENDDINWLSEFFGKEKAKTIPQLKPFHCFDYEDGEVSSYSIRTQAEKNKYFPIDENQLDNDNFL